MQNAIANMLSPAARLGIQRPPQRPRHQKQAPTCSSVSTNDDAGVASRRAVLSAFGVALLAGNAAPARAYYQSQVCEIGDEGRACRERALRDEANLDYGKEAKAGKATPLKPSNQNGATAINQDRYTQDTAELVNVVEAFLKADVYDPSRAGLIEKIKTLGNKWSGLYAPGGSPKRESGRAFYNCLQQLQGWFAFNGIAPLNKTTLEKVTRNLADTQERLAKGL